MRPSEALALHRAQIREIGLRHHMSDVRVFCSALHGDDTADSQGPLLEALRDPDCFPRCFVDAGALCWPNGLALSAARLYELSNAVKVAS